MAPAAGTLLARRDVAGWVFSSLVYEPRTVLGWHAHANPYLSFVETGSYTERLGGLTRHCETSTLLLHPAGERHANVFHDRAVNLLRVEASDADLLDVPLSAASSDGCRGEPSRSLCRRMLRELRAPDDLTPLALQGLALELIAGVARASTRRHREPACPGADGRSRPSGRPRGAAAR